MDFTDRIDALLHDEGRGAPQNSDGFSAIYGYKPPFLQEQNRVALEALAQRVQFCIYPVRDWSYWRAEDRHDIISLLRRGKDALEELIELLDGDEAAVEG